MSRRKKIIINAEEFVPRLIIELLVEAFFVGLFFNIYPMFLEAIHGIITFLMNIDADISIEFFGNLMPPHMMAGLSFIVRLLTLEIIIRYVVRFYFVRKHGFSLSRALISTFIIHTIILYLFFILVDEKLYSFGEFLFVTILVLPPSVMSALMAIVVMKYVFRNTFDSLIQKRETV